MGKFIVAGIYDALGDNYISVLNKIERATANYAVAQTLQPHTGHVAHPSL